MSVFSFLLSHIRRSLPYHPPMRVYDYDPRRYFNLLFIFREYLCTNKKKRKEGLKEAMNELDTSDEENVELNGTSPQPTIYVYLHIRIGALVDATLLVSFG